MKIRKTTDKISVKINDLVFKISPLTFDQKCEIQSVLASGGPMSIIKASKLAVKFALKDVQGLENENGLPYELKFDTEYVSDESIDDICNIHGYEDNLLFTCLSLLNGIPKGFENPLTKEPLPGVSLINEGESLEKK